MSVTRTVPAPVPSVLQSCHPLASSAVKYSVLPAPRRRRGREGSGPGTMAFTGPACRGVPGRRVAGPHPAPDVSGEGLEVQGAVRHAQVGRSGRRCAGGNVVDQEGPAGGALGPPELEAGLRRGGREEDGVAERPQVGRVREDGTARAWHDRRRAIAGPVAAPEPQAGAVRGAEEE